MVTFSYVVLLKMSFPIKVAFILDFKPEIGKLFTRRATFEKILKPRATLIGKAKKRSARPQVIWYFSSENQ